MIFLLIQASLSVHLINVFRDDSRPLIEYNLYFEPLDKIYLKIPKNIATFFPKFDDIGDLQLEVEAINSKGDNVTYGPFDSDSGLLIILFKTKDYLLKFSNEGLENISYKFILGREMIEDDIHYGEFKDYKSFDDIIRPIIFKFDKSKKSGKLSRGFMIAFLVIILVVYLFVGCKIGIESEI